MFNIFELTALKFSKRAEKLIFNLSAKINNSYNKKE